MELLLFIPLGFVTAMIGTLTGTGGGFLLVPVLLFLYPTMSPPHLTALSLLAVAANSISGSIGNALRRQIHWPSFFTFTVMALPGVYVGVQINQYVDRYVFEKVFGAFLFAVIIFILWRSFQTTVPHAANGYWNRRAKIIGTAVSFFVGMLSSLLGIGGGIIHVPLLAEVLRYPIHMATGTSQMILVITSLTAVAIHGASGEFNTFEPFVPYLIVGIVVGAQVGSALSKKVPRKLILRVLAFALSLVAVRLMF